MKKVGTLRTDSFLEEYAFMGDAVVGKIVPTTAVFKLEKAIYSFIKKRAQNANWKYLRVDTKDQIGFPDILLLRGNIYWQIEAKLLKKKKLTTIEDDLDWQFGQLAYMKRALTLNTNYLLAVAKDSNIIFIKRKSDERHFANYPDFIEQL